MPDQRLDHLAAIFKPQATHPAHLSITDIAGLIRGASEGAGLGNAFLSHIQSVDGLYHVVRAFDDADVVHVDDSVDPLRDLETIHLELCKKDLAILSQGIDRKAQTRQQNKPKPQQGGQAKQGGQLLEQGKVEEVVDKMATLLQRNMPVRDGIWTQPEIALINEHFRLLTTKPIVYLVNLSQEDYLAACRAAGAGAGAGNRWLPQIREWVSQHAAGSCLPVSVEFEQNLWDAQKTQQDGPAAASALPAIIAHGFEQLGLIYYFTAGEKEVRCWTVRQGTLAPQAAGVIHGDFEKAFIKAEVVAFDDFRALSGGKPDMAPVKAAGRFRVEGRNYVVRDGGEFFPLVVL